MLGVTWEQRLYLHVTRWHKLSLIRLRWWWEEVLMGGGCFILPNNRKSRCEESYQRLPPFQVFRCLGYVRHSQVSNRALIHWQHVFAIHIQFTQSIIISVEIFQQPRPYYSCLSEQIHYIDHVPMYAPVSTVCLCMRFCVCVCLPTSTVCIYLHASDSF